MHLQCIYDQRCFGVSLSPVHMFVQVASCDGNYDEDFNCFLERVVV